MKQHWVKQFTRENTLLERSLRMLAYTQAVREIWHSEVIQNPVVGHGKIISVYYKPSDYTSRQQRAFDECIDGGIENVKRMIVQFLVEALQWEQENRSRTFSKEEFLGYLQKFLYHHLRSRAAIVYGYWGSPAASAELRKLFEKSGMAAANIDALISLLSIPPRVESLAEVYTPSEEILKQKAQERAKLSQRERELAEMLSWFTFFYEVGERMATRLYDSFLEQLKQQVSREEYEELEWYDPASLVSYFEGKRLPKEEIERRRQQYLLEEDHGVIVVTSGATAEKRYQEEFEEQVSAETDSLKGSVACKGLVRGRVRIVITEEEQKEMQQGEILVSPMTTPRLLAACKKAAAIVTDEGGVTCHAAIVARELKKPCIIGTRVATRVLRTGDVVDVDAERGIVSVIERTMNSPESHLSRR